MEYPFLGVGAIDRPNISLWRVYRLPKKGEGSYEQCALVRTNMKPKGPAFQVSRLETKLETKKPKDETRQRLLARSA